MQFITIALAALSVGLATAQCYDAGDCILSGGGQCVKTAGAILGTCGATGTGTATSAKGSATGAVCFDAGDCIFNGGGQCVKKAGGITGNCAPSVKAAAALAARTPEPFQA